MGWKVGEMRRGKGRGHDDVVASAGGTARFALTS